ncbi:MAG: DegV family protein [Ktedonobacteraceae bacterium]|nr:DegV family protein [Ktedonobacteraceae bacterium]
MTVRIVTDSTADISPEVAEALGITVVPLTVFFGDEEYLDNVDLDNASFYRKLQESKSLPRTSQPPPAKFQAAYIQLMEEGADGILSVHLSSKLSGTYQSALTARNTLTEEEREVPIEVVDSKSISAGMFLGLQKAVAEAQKGLKVEEMKDHIGDQFARTSIFVVLDTLQYLHRGGRIGGARAFLGNMLNVKPIISLKEGAVVAVEQPRTRSKAFARLIQLAIGDKPIEQLAIAESNEEVGTQLAETVKAAYKGNIARYKLGAVLGTHTGPGTVGLVVVHAKQ